MTEKRYDDEFYKGHAIRILAERHDANSAWIIEIHIQTPDGSHLPVIRDDDDSYSSIEIAFATGKEQGRQYIDS